MERQDKGLAWMLQYENIAWYEDGVVRILDRRIYPIEVKKVECRTYQEVADAIHDMVTQSAGPYTAAAMGMALAAYECRGRSEAEHIEYLESVTTSLHESVMKVRMVPIESAVQKFPRMIRDLEKKLGKRKIICARTRFARN